MRKLLEIEQQGADLFFGERSFDVEDLIKQDEKGLGSINILRLDDIQSKPRLFSTFMLCLLAEIYEKFPEQGMNQRRWNTFFVQYTNQRFTNSQFS